MKSLLLLTIIFCCTFTAGAQIVDSPSTLNFGVWGTRENGRDTVEVARLISDTRKSTFFRHTWSTPFAAHLFAVIEGRRIIYYLDRNKKPLHPYWKIWPNY